MTGGGLDVDGDRWVSSKPKFLFPVKVISKLFRGKFLHALSKAHARGNLEFAGGCAQLKDPKNFAALKDKLYSKEWNVFSKKPFGGPEAVFNYLGRYTHRVAISNQRLIAMDDQGVTFFTKDGGTATLEPNEFIRRFLMHVLPSGYTKIRHFGLLAAGNVNTKLARAKALLLAECKDIPASNNSGEKPGDTWLDKILAIDNDVPSVCPHCGIGKMIRSYIKPGAGFPNIPKRRNTS